MTDRFLRSGAEFIYAYRWQIIVPTKDGPGTAVHNWLANPGIPIPDGAAAIHGVTTERAVAEGRPAADGFAELLAGGIADGPLAVEQIR